MEHSAHNSIKMWSVLEGKYIDREWISCSTFKNELILFAGILTWNIRSDVKIVMLKKHRWYAANIHDTVIF